jgi:hypothetical protein
MTRSTAIHLDVSTRDELKKMVESMDDTYDSVIRRLIASFKTRGGMADISALPHEDREIWWRGFAEKFNESYCRTPEEEEEAVKGLTRFWRDFIKKHGHLDISIPNVDDLEYYPPFYRINLKAIHSVQLESHTLKKIKKTMTEEDERLMRLGLEVDLNNRLRENPSLENDMRTSITRSLEKIAGNIPLPMKENEFNEFIRALKMRNATMAIILDQCHLMGRVSFST